ncbi:MAG: hypothetical protein WA002_13565 [Candidatus Acidiferrales bacterium]
MGVSEIGILILDADLVSQQALHHLLGSEGWRVQFVTDSRQLLEHLSSGAWNLAIVNIELALPHEEIFGILRDLAHAEGITVAAEAQRTIRTSAKKSAADIASVRKRRLRVLFIVPADAAPEVLPHLEREELPYAIRPYHLHDFFEKVSDLLIEAGALPRPTRGSRFDTTHGDRFRKKADDASASAMFSSRRDYQMTEEEVAEYERQEEEERRKKTKKDEEHEW